MKYRTLGKTGMQVSEVGVGAWQLGGPLMLDGKADGIQNWAETFAFSLSASAAIWASILWTPPNNMATVKVNAAWAKR